MPGSGSCCCEAVRYSVSGPLRSVTNCHCVRCRRITGHFLAATAANVIELIIDDSASNLRWYEPSPGVYYGFCGICGSTLFWRIDDRPDVWSIAAGTLNPPTGLETNIAWYVSEASDYHVLDHSLEEHATE